MSGALRDLQVPWPDLLIFRDAQRFEFGRFLLKLNGFPLKHRVQTTRCVVMLVAATRENGAASVPARVTYTA